MFLTKCKSTHTDACPGSIPLGGFKENLVRAKEVKKKKKTKESQKYNSTDF